MPANFVTQDQIMADLDRVGDRSGPLYVAIEGDFDYVYPVLHVALAPIEGQPPVIVVGRRMRISGDTAKGTAALEPEIEPDIDAIADTVEEI